MTDALQNSGYPQNDDVLLSLASIQNGVTLDTSMSSGIVETQYNFFYDPPIPDNWIILKRPRNEFTTRYHSDIWSLQKYIEFRVEIDIHEMCRDILRAIRFMDRSGRIEYIVQNIGLLWSYYNYMDHIYDGELLYYIMKYCPDSDTKISTITRLECYNPDIEYVDTYFYYGIVNRKVSIDTYKSLRVTTGTWRDKFS